MTHTLGAKYSSLPEMSYEDWLKQVAARLRQHAATIDSGAAPAPPTV